MSEFQSKPSICKPIKTTEQLLSHPFYSNLLILLLSKEINIIIFEMTVVMEVALSVLPIKVPLADK